MWILNFEGTSAAAPAAAELERAWTADAATVARLGAMPTALDADDFAALAAGEVVAHRTDGPDGAVATGAVWVPVPIEPAWITISDQNHRPLGRTAAEERLP